MESRDGRRSSRRTALLAGLLLVVLAAWAALSRIERSEEPLALDATLGPAPSAVELGELAAAPPRAEPSPRAAASERRVVEESDSRSPRGRPASIRLSVVDAETELELSEVGVRELSVAVEAKPNAARDMDAGWILSPPLEEQPGPHVLALPIIASGASPLDCPTAYGVELWITARGYGWARLSLFEEWPEQVTVRLRRGALLEVFVTNYTDYSRLLLTVQPSATEKRRWPKPLRRTALEGSVTYSGLPSGDYDLEITGFTRGSRELERMRHPVRLRTHERRREVLSLETHYGDLALRFVEPLEAQGMRALQELHIESLGPGVSSIERTARVTSFDHRIETAPGAGESTSTKTLRLHAGKTRVTVKPHGVQYEVDVVQGSTVSLDRRLPRPYRRRIVLWDTRLDAPWPGRVRAFRDSPDGSTSSLTPLIDQWIHPSTGEVEAFWPAVPFRLLIDQQPVHLSPELLRYESGELLAADLRIELSSPEEEDGLERPSDRGR